MGRSTKDLIDELREEAKGANIAALIVEFEDHTEFVYSKSLDPLQNLNALIKDGGEPVSILRIVKEGKEMELSIRPLKEYADQEWIRSYLAQLGTDFINIAKEAKGAEIIAYNSIESFDEEEGGKIGNS